MNTGAVQMSKCVEVKTVKTTSELNYKVTLWSFTQCGSFN